MSAADTNKSVTQLREIFTLLSTAVEKLASEWELRSSKDPLHTDTKGVDSSVSHVEYNTVKTVLAAVGSLESLILEPHARVISLSISYTIARALHIAAENNIAEVLARAGDDGLLAADLARSTGIEEKKLCKYTSQPMDGELFLADLSVGRIMRSLTSHHIFQEVKEDCFANNHVSQVLVGDAPFRSHILMKCVLPSHPKTLLHVPDIRQGPDSLHG
jgi:hypothetical protein